ncbi:MAG: DUF2225 domain-containing protein [Spirochaetales bacterium]|nr:DUF2225 domain-containing protein [Spirochaetales bacterium]
MTDGTANRVTFFSKKETVCPVDGSKFYREEILTGRGRLIAGDLNSELRRLYEPSVKYGKINPLIYAVTVCPGCYYAALAADFEKVPESSLPELENGADSRIEAVRKILGELDYHEPRDTAEGAASYLLALMSYDAFPKDFSPVVKQAVCSLRAAWLFNDMHSESPTENYDYIARLFYRKAAFFYDLALEYEQSGKQSITAVGHLGPDLDQNYGYDGVLYLFSYLTLHYGAREDEEHRQQALRQAKTTVAKLFGMGKASKQKPGPLLDKARDLYAIIAEKLEDDEEEEADA